MKIQALCSPESSSALLSRIVEMKTVFEEISVEKGSSKTFESIFISNPVSRGSFEPVERAIKLLSKGGELAFLVQNEDLDFALGFVLVRSWDVSAQAVEAVRDQRPSRLYLVRARM